MQASSPTDAGQGPAELYKLSPPQAGNAPLRRLCRQLPLQESLFGGICLQSLPCKGRWMRRKAQTEGCGALPCQYPSGPAQTFPAGVNACPTIQGIRAHNRGQQATAAPDHRNACVGADASTGGSSPLKSPQYSRPLSPFAERCAARKKEKAPGWQIPGSLLRRLVSYAQARAARQRRGVPFSGSAGAGAPISPKSRAAFCCGWGGAACAAPWPRFGGCAHG